MSSIETVTDINAFFAERLAEEMQRLGVFEKDPHEYLTRLIAENFYRPEGEMLSSLRTADVNAVLSQDLDQKVTLLEIDTKLLHNSLIVLGDNLLFTASMFPEALSSLRIPDRRRLNIKYYCKKGSQAYEKAFDIESAPPVIIALSQGFEAYVCAINRLKEKIKTPAAYSQNPGFTGN